MTRTDPVFVEEREVLSHREFPGGQYRLQLHSVAACLIPRDWQEAQA